MKSTDGPVSRFINRRISSRITSFIVSHSIPLTPNSVSVLSFLMALSTVPLYLLNSPISAGILVQLSSIFDGVDGELARATGRSSNRGAFFDTMLDRFSDVAMILGASLYLWSRTFSESTLIISFLAVSGSLLVSYLHSEGRRLLGTHPAFLGRMPQIASRDVRLFVLFIFSLLDQLFFGLLLISFLSFFYVIFKTAESLKGAEIKQ
ncbi:MAG: CDP-L-myo-inositol myo-inositolphosphotransferase [Archaeoglobi archaeon]|nr:CDP-alcohol phosphatidyltransferase family protein [Candidatus Mnemosynella bozhongmuii]MDI3502082.1 CDP-L-myo-inositol myo-inositolphosphotransferase [Archaeoglobi archaeon]MDK2782116.1 CDP-L-myo-inositol myo-inositolphosphotransferase [Archaeoglobi archaeon]